MARRPGSDPDLDHLYQLPLDAFISERNALARRLGPRGAEVRNLQKPTLPAWTVNQLFWRQRDTYDQLVARAADLQATQQAALSGRRADVRAASRAHDEAVDRALKSALRILADHGGPVTDATRQAIATTLRGLPADEEPGRLTRPLQPRGFEMLVGTAAPGRVRTATPAARPGKPTRAGAEPDRTARIAAAREEAARASRAARDAEQTSRREEFEAARAAREAEKAQRRVQDAESAVQEAQAELAEAQRVAERAAKIRQAARARADKAAEELAAAREREDAARQHLQTLT